MSWQGRKSRFQKLVEVDEERDSGEIPKHAVMEVPAGGRDAINKALVYLVGPPCNWAYGQTYNYRKSYLVLWGEHLKEEHFRMLSDACHDVERENADMSIYEGARNAERMAGKAIDPVQIGNWGGESE